MTVFYNPSAVKDDVIFRHGLAEHSIELTLPDSSRNYDRTRGNVSSVTKVHRGFREFSLNPCGHGSVATRLAGREFISYELSIQPCNSHLRLGSVFRYTILIEIKQWFGG